jgi:hypothetical protein
VSILDSFRKGFRFFLMSMGVSTYPQKPPPAARELDSTVAPAKKPE